MMLKKILLLSGLALSLSFQAQAMHTVAKGDNPYSIAKKYGISLDELVRMNPDAKSGKLSIGQVLVVGKKSAPKPAEKAVKTTTPALGKITLQPKQTLYGITKQYHISEAELRKLNPNLEMKIGSEVILPMQNIKSYGGSQAASAEVAVQQKPEVKPVADVTNVAADSYEIQPKDNYFKLTRKFGLSQQQLFALNPGLEGKGLQPGDVIRIKGSATENIAVNSSASEPSRSTGRPTYVETSVQDDFVTYTVQSGDTVFGILNRFGITLDQLMNLNPQLSNGLRSGMVLKIKKADEAYVKKNDGSLNVVLMLPFGFNSNDSKFRTMSADFLSGAKLAIEQSAAAGQKLNVKIIDAGNEQSFKNSLIQINQDNTDLIIGPFLKSNVMEVMDYLGSKKIPVVAPFANSEDLYGYSNLIIAEPSDEVYADRIAREISQVYSDQKIYIVADNDRTAANNLKAKIEKSVRNPNVVVVNSPLDIQPDKNMMTGQSAPLIAVLASSDADKAEAFANRVIAVSKETSTKAFSMYYNPFFEKKQDELSQSNFTYLMDRTINTEGSFEREVLAAYKKKYCKTPPKYAIIGFDVVKDILSRENSRGEVLRQMGKVQTQLATKYEYVRAKANGAYINNGYRVVRLVPQ